MKSWLALTRDEVPTLDDDKDIAIKYSRIYSLSVMQGGSHSYPVVCPSGKISSDKSHEAP